jgi:hypothetical protein
MEVRNRRSDYLIFDLFLSSAANFFSKISFGNVNLTVGSIVRVTLTSDYPAVDEDLTACNSLFVEALTLAGPSPLQDLILVPGEATDCGIGLSYTDCWPCFASAYGGPICDGVGITVHELLHSVGLYHSNLLNGNSVLEYGDGSCQMGFSVADSLESLNRKGVSAPQLDRLNVIPASQIASDLTTFDLVSLYSDDDQSLKLFKMGTEMVSFRSSYDFGIDAHVNAMASGVFSSSFNARGFASYSDVVYVHRNPANSEAPVLICALQPGESCNTLDPDRAVHCHSLNETHARISIFKPGTTPLVLSPQVPSGFPHLFAIPAAGAATGVTIVPQTPQTVTFPGPPALSSNRMTIVGATLVLSTIFRDAALNLNPGGCGNVQITGEYRIRDEIQIDVTSLVRPGQEMVSISLASDSNFRFFSGADCNLDGLLGNVRCGPRIDYIIGRKGDVDQNERVDLLDVFTVIENWGPCLCCRTDVNNDGVVDLLDVLEVIENWG